jgi:thiol-disulfide isomerase/thioredoxin
VAALVFACASTGRAQIKVGDVFPPLAAAGLAGEAPPALAGKVALIDFWASWCAPCKASFPVYSRLQTDLASSGLVVIAISIDERPADYAAFVQKMRPTFAVAHDVKQALVKVVQVPAMPTCYLVDRSGHVRFVHAGFHSGTTEALIRREIGTLLAEPASL